MERARVLGLLDAEAATIAELRELSRREAALFAEPPQVAELREVEIAGPEAPLVLRVYVPPGEPPFRPVVFIHGGGWVVGDLDQSDVDCRCLCLDTRSLVVSVGYRLAPEHRFPAGLEDCYSAFEWVAAEAGTLGGDRERLVVAGDSAGGNLAAAVALMARERSGPGIERQILIYPITDCSFDTESYVQFAEGYWLERDDMRWMWENYLGEGASGDDPRASVLRASDLSGLPDAVIVTAGCDVLRDDGAEYAERLREAGVSVELMEYPGQIHGFWSCGAISSLPRDVNARIAVALDGNG